MSATAEERQAANLAHLRGAVRELEAAELRAKGVCSLCNAKRTLAVEMAVAKIVDYARQV
jgi:hypothetical protein